MEKVNSYPKYPKYPTIQNPKYPTIQNPISKSIISNKFLSKISSQHVFRAFGFPRLLIFRGEKNEKGFARH